MYHKHYFFYRLFRVSLHERHMLVRCRMKNNLRAVRTKHLVHCILIADIFHQRDQGYPPAALRKLHLHVVSIVLTVIQNQKLPRFKVRDLPA